MDSVKTFHPRQSVILAVADSEALRNLVGFHHHDLRVDASKSYEDRASCLRQRAKMKREYFVKVVGETLDSLPQEFRSRIPHIAVLVEDMPAHQPSPQSGRKGSCFWVSSTACLRPRRAILTCRQGLITSCSIRRISKRSSPARRKSGNKSA